MDIREKAEASQGANYANNNYANGYLTQGRQLGQRRLGVELQQRQHGTTH